MNNIQHAIMYNAIRGSALLHLYLRSSRDHRLLKEISGPGLKVKSTERVTIFKQTVKIWCKSDTK